MKRNTGRRALPIALSVLTATPMMAALTSVPASAATARAAKTTTIKGPVEYVDHGPVQAIIAVKKGKITTVKVANAPQEGRSVFIQGQAIPILKQETLKAQSAKIQLVSGATDTSEGYVLSLQAAVKKARQIKVLK